MSEIKVVPLGAGQDVGRSCILVSLSGKNIMLDCGMHMGFNDDRRFPDFSYITESGRSLTEHIDCLIVSHFHLDHCGALPYFTEMCGYDGPIFMTHPTKAICPILLEDYRKITVERKGEQNFFTSQMIKDCMKKVTTVNLHQTVKVGSDGELEIKAYYAGHVLGAAMFLVRVRDQSIVYTGDYNMTPDRHLGSAWIDKCQPDLLITESTYATTIRDSKRCRERDFLKKIHECMERDGKALIPVFALGRAQELCILLETFWDRMNLKHPIYFSTGLTEKANHYYKLFITWTNQKIRSTFVQRNMFEFKHIKPFDRSYIDNPGPMVVFATPGMLHAGLSLQIFKKWAEDEKNMLIMPGYCVAGTIGHKVLSGAKKIEIDKKMVNVRLSVQYMSFSAHADAKGIMQLIRQADPKNVMLVHGEAAKMEFLKQKVMQEFGINCFMPANGEMVAIQTPPIIPADISRLLLKRTLQQCYANTEMGYIVFLDKCGSVIVNIVPSITSTVNDLCNECRVCVENQAGCWIGLLAGFSPFSLIVCLAVVSFPDPNPHVGGGSGDIRFLASDAKQTCPAPNTAPVTGLLVMKNETLQLLDPSEAQSELGLVPHDLKYSSTLSLDTRTRPQMEFMDALFQVVQKLLPDHRVIRATDRDHHLSIDGSSITVEVTTFEPLQEILITWGVKDERLGDFIFSTLQRNLSRLL